MSQNVSKPARAKQLPVDRHKPSRMVRVKAALATQLEALAARNATSLAQEVNRAVRELLVREGLWPPAGTT
jgi:hypothetical protein